MFKKIRQRNCLLLIILCVFAPFVLLVMLMGPELSTEQSLSQRLAECHMRMQYLETMYRSRQEDVAVLTQYLSLALQQSNNNINSSLLSLTQITTSTTTASLTSSSNSFHSNVLNNNNNHHHNVNDVYNIDMQTSPTVLSLTSVGAINNLMDSLSPETRQLLRNLTHNQSIHHFRNNFKIRLPTVYNFLPHLLDNSASLRPAYLQTKNRNEVSIVLGIPTVKREKQSYLLGTLKNLIENMNEEEQNETLIAIYIGENDYDTVQYIAKQILIAFEQHIESGLIDIIAPAPSYYPDFERLRITLNDPLERVKWRSKQNLDFAYLMAYAQTKGTFYVQLEDDILAKRNFITAMKKFALTKSALTKQDQTPWFILDFCQLGFIGKMFKSSELPYLITFFQMFYNDQPVDWLLSYFIESKVCRTDIDQKHCNQEKAKYWLHYKPSLFQHIGTSSSLKGKVQKLKDKQFGSKVPTFYGHKNNPAAKVKTNIVAYKNYILKRAYRGESYFWGLLPQPGDLVEFIFEQPLQLKHYLFRSGNSEHPSDRFYNTTIEVLPVDSLSENSSVWSTYNTTTDGFLIIGNFDAMGVAEGGIDTKIGAIKEIRLHVHGDSENWVLLSEILLQSFGQNNNGDDEQDDDANTNQRNLFKGS